MKKLMILFLVLGSYLSTDAQEQTYRPFDNNQFYIMGGVSRQVGGHWKYQSGRSGLSIDVGSTYYIKKLNRRLNRIGFGIDVVYLDLNVSLMDSKNDETGSLSYFSIGSEMGPLVSYRINDKFSVDAFYRLGMIQGGKSTSNRENLGLVGYRGVSQNIGGNLRFRRMKLGLEADLGHLQDRSFLKENNVVNTVAAFELKFGFSF